MIKKAWLLMVVVLAIGVFTGFMFAKGFDYLIPTSDKLDSHKADGDRYRREATEMDYFSIEEFLKTPDLVVVGRNFVKYNDGAREFIYADFDDDGIVDEYDVTDWDSWRQDGGRTGWNVVSINSLFVWDKIYRYESYRFNDAIKYAGKNLQKRIDDDYKKLREIGKKTDDCKGTPGSNWYNEYPVKVKCE